MSRPMFAILVAAIAILLGVFAASRLLDDDDSDPAVSASGTPSPTPEIITEATREREDIELTVTIDEEEYGPGDEIPATAVVKNKRGTPITFTPIVPGEAAFRMEALSVVALGTSPLAPTGDAPPAEGSIDPNGELELEVV